MATQVKAGKTEWKVRIASLATFVGSLAVLALTEGEGVALVRELPPTVKMFVFPLLVALGAWLSGRLAHSRPEYISPSTIDAVRAHLAHVARKGDSDPS